MRGLKAKICGLFLFLSFLQIQSKAVEFTWTQGNYTLPYYEGYANIGTLYTFNNVTVTINDGGGVGNFYMHDNSSVTMLNSSTINYLYLYENASASFFHSSYMNTLYIDPANTGLVKIYGTFEEMGSSPSLFIPSYGQGHMHGYFTSGGYFDINLQGTGAFSHIQFVPEPATLLMLALGGLTIFRCRR